MIIKRFFLLGTAIASLLIVGCGGGDDDGTVSVETGELSKKEFIRQAGAICEEKQKRFVREYTAFFTKALPQNDSLPSREEQEVLISELVTTVFLPIFRPAVQEISALGAPRGDEQEISSFLTALQQRLDEIEEQPSKLGKTARPLTKPAKLADEYGLAGCRRGLGGS